MVRSPTLPKASLNYSSRKLGNKNPFWVISWKFLTLWNSTKLYMWKVSPRVGKRLYAGATSHTPHQNVTSACFGAHKIDFTTAPDAKPDVLDHQRSRMPLGKPFERGSVPGKTESTIREPISRRPPKERHFRTCNVGSWLRVFCLCVLVLSSLGFMALVLNFFLAYSFLGSIFYFWFNTVGARAMDLRTLALKGEWKKKIHTFWQLGSATSLLGL